MKTTSPPWVGPPAGVSGYGGDGHEASANSPLPGLLMSLRQFKDAGVPAYRIVMGLPWCGRERGLGPLTVDPETSRKPPKHPETTTNIVWTGLKPTPKPRNQDRKAVNNHGWDCTARPVWPRLGLRLRPRGHAV
jgi:hypothetical protein